MSALITRRGCCFVLQCVCSKPKFYGRNPDDEDEVTRMPKKIILFCFSPLSLEAVCVLGLFNAWMHM